MAKKKKKVAKPPATNNHSVVAALGAIYDGVATRNGILELLCSSLGLDLKLLEYDETPQKKRALRQCHKQFDSIWESLGKVWESDIGDLAYKICVVNFCTFLADDAVLRNKLVDAGICKYLAWLLEYGDAGNFEMCLAAAGKFSRHGG